MQVAVPVVHWMSWIPESYHGSSLNHRSSHPVEETLNAWLCLFLGVGQEEPGLPLHGRGPAPAHLVPPKRSLWVHAFLELVPPPNPCSKYHKPQSPCSDLHPQGTEHGSMHCPMWRGGRDHCLRRCRSMWICGLERPHCYMKTAQSEDQRGEEQGGWQCTGRGFSQPWYCHTLMHSF